MRITFRLSDSLKEKIGKIANEKSISQSAVIKEILKNSLYEKPNKNNKSKQ